MRKRTLKLAYPLFGLSCCVPLLAQAQTTSSTTTLEEIVITAEHRDSSLQKAALAVTAISGEDIARSGSSDIVQILQNVPSLVMQNVSGGNSTQSVQGSGAPPNIAIRGLGTDGPNRAGAVAVYQDGILLQGGGGNSYDMSRVEVLRGPQGTLYGRGATAGAVNFITNEPTKNFEASGRVQFGSYNLIATQGMINVPLSDDWSVRAAFNQVKHNGYFSNGQSDENDISSRVKLRYSPSDSFSLTLGGVIYDSSSSSPGVVDATTDTSPSDWTSTLSGGTKSPNAYRKFYADLEADLDFANLTYLGGYQTSHSYFTSYCGCFFGMTGQGTYVAVDSPYNNTQTHELRLASKGDSALTWQGGIYYYHNRLQQQFRLSTAGPTVGQPDSPFTTNLQHYSPTSMGLFGEATYALTTATRVTAGVRETRDHVVQDACSNCAPGTAPVAVDAKNNRFDWKARVDTDLTENNLLYGTISTGYRPGAVVQGAITDIESVRAYEVGSKNRLGNAITMNGAVYYYDYSGFQNVLAQVVGGTVQTTVIPIPATFYGVELEFVAQLSPNDKLTLSPAYESAKYTDSCLTCVVGMGPTSGTAQPLLTKNGEIPHTPKLSVSGGYEHAFMLNGGAQLTWSVDAHYQSKSMTDFDASNYPVQNPAYVQGAYTIANSSLTYASDGGKYSFTAYSRNITNKLYKAALGNSNPAGSPPSYAFMVNDPRTYGVMLTVKM